MIQSIVALFRRTSLVSSMQIRINFKCDFTYCAMSIIYFLRNECSAIMHSWFRFDGKPIDASFALLHNYICSYCRILDFQLRTARIICAAAARHRERRAQTQCCQRRRGVGVRNNCLYLRELFFVVINCKYNFSSFGRLSLFAFIKITRRTHGGPTRNCAQ